MTAIACKQRIPTMTELLAKAQKPFEESMRLHPLYKGKVQMMSKCPIGDLADFAIWYTPGVAAPCKAIQHHRELVYEHTNKGNCIAVVSDGSRVLGLGNIGPEAGLPVMEGKALLFKYLGGVDAVPICLGTQDTDELIHTVKLLEPSFGGVNLEDIAQPKCFRVLDGLKKELTIPVWHDDQQGTATVLLAGLLNALRIVGKEIRGIKIAMIGMGAANVSVYRMLKTSLCDPAAIVACDSNGTLHPGRHDIRVRQKEFAEKWQVCNETNGERVAGGVAEALRGADVCIAFSASGPGIIRTEWVKQMAKDAIVFTCANPVPEIWPWEAREAGARIVATGRSDFPNQLNNSLGFPGIFRGVLDVRARFITDEMALAAAHELAAFAAERGIHEESILPRMDEWEVFAREAVATALKAQEQGVAALSKSPHQLYQDAMRIMRAARDATRLLIEGGIIEKASEIEKRSAGALSSARL
ncbi:MAG: NADP-dependent malic enzyme [Acidobacteria bacterium]|nr:NADP-dependent malic enzyme [Acidobacteriota bacterium]